MKSIESRKERCIQEGVLGLGPKTAYLSRMNSSVKERSRFQNRSMISQVEWEKSQEQDNIYEVEQEESLDRRNGRQS